MNDPFCCLYVCAETVGGDCNSTIYFVFIHLSQVNTDWKEQRLDVVVATVAFGMGLDRPSAFLLFVRSYDKFLKSCSVCYDPVSCHPFICCVTRSLLSFAVNSRRCASCDPLESPWQFGGVSARAHALSCTCVCSYVFTLLCVQNNRN